MKTRASNHRRSSLRAFLSMIGCWLLVTTLISCASCQDLSPLNSTTYKPNPTYSNLVNLQQALDVTRSVMVNDGVKFRAVAAGVVTKCEANQQVELLTAAHVVYAYQRMMGTGTPLLVGDGPKGLKKFMLMRVVKINKKKDLALLRSIFKAKKDCKAVSLVRNAPPIGSRVFAVGSPLGYVKYVTSGILSTIIKERGRETYRTDAAVEGGASGGGLFNDHGQLVGLVVSRLQFQMEIGPFKIPIHVAGHGVVVSINEIKSFLGVK